MPLSSFEKNIQQYAPTDSGQFSNKDLGRAYWIVTHKVLLRNVAIAFLLAVDVLLVGYAVFGFVNYILIGNKDERDAVAAVAGSLASDTAERLKKYSPQSLIIGEPEVFVGMDNRYDIVAPLENPNEQWILTLTLAFAADGAEISLPRTIIMLPQEKKFLTDLGHVFPDGAPVSPTVKIVQQEWYRIDRHEIQDVRAFMDERHLFEISDAQFLPSGLAGGGATLSGNKISFIITNKTAHNFHDVPVQIVLLRGGLLVGIEETIIRNFKTNEARSVDVRSYAQITVDEVQVIPSVNIFDPDVYSTQ